MKYLIIIFSLLFVYSCATVKKNENYNPLTTKTEMKNLSLKGTISTSFPAMNQSFGFALKLAKKDSLRFEAFGPLSIVVGRLYAGPDFFRFYNVITSDAFEGTPSAKNLNLAMNLPLSYSDFVSFLRCEPAQDIETFTIDEGYNSDSKVLFKSEQKGFVDYVLVDKKMNYIIQQQRKIMDGTIILSVVYSDYEEYDGYYIANSIKFDFPKLSGNVLIKNNNVGINENYDKPFNFYLPSSVKVIRFD
jgi:hypothetical protein